MSSTQFVEHVSFVASEAFLADNALFDQLKAWLDKNGEGYKRQIFSLPEWLVVY